MIDWTLYQIGFSPLQNFVAILSDVVDVCLFLLTLILAEYVEVAYYKLFYDIIF